jgi:ribosome-associated toxin RatA of RatAB toxin-antitoxin module
MRTALMIGVLLLAATLAARGAQDEPVISVSETGGDYVVNARFVVAESPEVVREVLTDYPAIPRFMPDVRTSRLVHRGERTARVEQEAVSKFMWFSKTIHLVLDVEEGDEVITFRDRCARSFRRYEGSWTIKRDGERTELTYQLAAHPAFSVPGFVLRKLLNRDAVVMVDRLRTEIRARGSAR